MNLIKKVTTNILYSDIDPVAGFYNCADSFYVAYNIKKEINGNINLPVLIIMEIFHQHT